MSPNIYLTHDENKALHLFSEGKTSHVIQEKCTLPLSGIGFFTAEIRRKTGLLDLQFHQGTRAYIEQHAEALKNPPLSADNLWILRLWLAGNNVHTIAHRAGKSPEDIAESFESSLKHAGIYTDDDRAIRFQLRVYLACFHGNTSCLSTTKLRFMQLMVEGKSLAAIAEETGEKEPYVHGSINEVCTALGLCTRGKDAQRQLICAYVRAKQLLDDPDTFLAEEARRAEQKAEQLHVPPSLSKRPNVTQQHYDAFFQKTIKCTLERLMYDMGCSVEKAIDRGLKLAKRMGVKTTEESILSYNPKTPDSEFVLPAGALPPKAPSKMPKPPISPDPMDDPSF